MNTHFEPQFVKMAAADASREIKVSKAVTGLALSSAGEEPPIEKPNAEYGLNWIAHPTKEGFLYFSIPGTNTYQWAFPKVFDAKTNSNKALFV